MLLPPLFVLLASTAALHIRVPSAGCRCVPPCMHLGRRQALVAGVGGLLLSQQLPAPASAVQKRKALVPLVPELVQILRVREAAGQEARLLESGKYKDVQRANVKRAVQVTSTEGRQRPSVAPRDLRTTRHARARFAVHPRQLRAARSLRRRV